MAKQCVVNRDKDGNIISVSVENPNLVQQDNAELIQRAIERNGGKSLDKAPNGEDSILYQSFIDQGFSDQEAQEKVAQVYTDNFGSWFGRWWESPEESSRVVDINGQPLVVWSGQQAPVIEFKAYTKRTEGTDDIDNDGFFAEDKRISTSYATGLDAFTTPQAMIEKYGAKNASIIPVYLSIKNVQEVENINRTTITPLIPESLEQGKDGFYGKFHEKYGASNSESKGWVILDGNQVRKVNENNTIDERSLIKQNAERNNTWLKAPNGEKSNLNSEQWIEVRTKEFKDWFGDWENDSKNASKMVDENGEPKILKHATPNKFSIFKVGEFPGILGYGIYFTDSENAINEMVNRKKYKNVMSVYINVRNPEIIGSSTNVIYDKYNTEDLLEISNIMQSEGIDGIFRLNFDNNGTNDYMVYNSNQIMIQSISSEDDLLIKQNEFIPSQLYEELKQQPFIDSEQALEAYKNIYTEEVGDWQNADLDC